MAVSFAREVAAGFMAAVMEEQETMDRLRKAGRLGGAVVSEIAAGLALAPHLGRAVRVHRSLPVAGTAAADTGDGTPFGVVLHPSIPYGPGHRQLLDVYVPFDLYQSRCPAQRGKARARWQAAGGGGGGPGGAAGDAPVLFFVHGGIWATGDRFYFAPMAVRLAQAGMVVVVISYTLYPEAMADVMAAEVLRALTWTLSNARAYGGDPSRLAVAGHSAGGHLGALALIMLARLRQEEAAARRAGGAPSGAGGGAAGGGGGGGGAWAPGPVLGLPRVQLFVGMSGVYHVARHHEYEASRGVHQLSTMGRACGGPDLWEDISPAVVLARAAADAAAAAAAAASSSSASAPAPRQPIAGAGSAEAAASGAGGPGSGSYYGAFALAGEAVPYRSGLDASPSAAAAAGGASSAGPPPGAPPPRRRGRHHTRHHFHRHAAGGGAGGGGADPGLASAALGAPAPDGPAAGLGAPPERRREFWEDGVLVIVEEDDTSDGGRPSSGGRQLPGGGGQLPDDNRWEGLEDTLRLLGGFRVEDAAQLPPAVLMSSLADHMVQWHEAQEMAMRLLQLRVPVKHLVYGGTSIGHNDFVFNWRPLPFDPAAAGPAPSSAPPAMAPQPAAAGGAPPPPAGGGGYGGVGGGYGGGYVAGGEGDDLAELPPFARDLLLILQGRVRVRFLTGPPPSLAPASKL